MPRPTVRVEGTPNPNAAKFVLDRPLPVEGSRSYFDPSAAAGDALAERLFAVEGVEALFMVDDFITVTKAEGREWPELVDRLREVIASTLATGREG